jgi:hypothetical protein
VLGVGKLCLELNRAGCLRDLVVDEVDLAFIKLDLVVLTVSENRERLLVISHLLLNFRQICLGKREDQRYRLDLGDDDETIRVRRVNDLPTSICRTPVMPEIGEVSWVYPSSTCACSISAWSDLMAFKCNWLFVGDG